MNITKNPSPIDFDALTSTTDIHGKGLAVGARVRSYDFPGLYDGQITGFDVTGPHAAFKEGVIEAIETVPIEGCSRYRILVDRSVFGGIEESLSHLPESERIIYPPLNGTPSFLYTATFGVVAI